MKALTRISAVVIFSEYFVPHPGSEIRLVVAYANSKVGVEIDSSKTCETSYQEMRRSNYRIDQALASRPQIFY